jgi:hypothetical protein
MPRISSSAAAQRTRANYRPSAIDITERKQAQQEREKRQNQLAHSQQMEPACLFGIDGHFLTS